MTSSIQPHCGPAVVSQAVETISRSSFPPQGNSGLIVFAQTKGSTITIAKEKLKKGAYNICALNHCQHGIMTVSLNKS
jgi:hypothetical protein